MLTTISGHFVKIARAEDLPVLLSRGDPARPAARFNRLGQDALYLSPDEDSARVAIGQYVTPDDRERVLVAYRVSDCTLFDLRAPAASDLYALARRPWQQAMKDGQTPPSRVAADRLRTAGHAELIDPSRRQPGLWHITLFRWNEPGAPAVKPVGNPKRIDVLPDDR